MIEYVIHAINHYGYIVLFLALLLELLALPLPGEILMSYVGFLVFQGKMNWMVSILLGSMGASLGMTLAYGIGFRLGRPFTNKYGKYIHMSPERLDKLSAWFGSYGYKLFAITFFIPGVRHVTGYFAGVTRIPFKNYALYTYGGSLFWVGTFITLGKLLGPQWEKFHSTISRYLFIGIIGLLIVIGVIYVFRRYNPKIMIMFNNFMNRALVLFHSMGRVKLIIALASLFGLTLLFISIGLIQDYVSNEFDQFNTVVWLIANSMIEEGWLIFSKYGSILVSLPISVIVVVSVTIWVFVKSRERGLELRFLVIILAGGEVWGELLQNVFHHIGPAAPTDFSKIIEISFPSEPSLTAMVLYGYTAYMIYRLSKASWLKALILPVFIIVLVTVGINLLIYKDQIPSDIVAGYVFGGVWITFFVVLLEVFRIIQNTSKLRGVR